MWSTLGTPFFAQNTPLPVPVIRSGVDPGVLPVARAHRKPVPTVGPGKGAFGSTKGLATWYPLVLRALKPFLALVCLISNLLRGFWTENLKI